MKITKVTISLILLIIAIIILAICLYNAQKEKSMVQAPTVSIEDEDQQGKGELAKDILGNEEMLILANKQNELENDFKPTDLERVKYFAPGRDDAARFMRSQAAKSMNQMLEAAKAEGYEIVITTAYRSYNLQKIIFDNNVKKSGSVEIANKTSAKPGQSEHQTGLAADLSSKNLDYELTAEFGDTDEGKWISENAWEYGFILRYPKDKEEITGYSYEPWHVRYVGNDFAKFIYDNQLTLEEFILERNAE